MELLSGEVRGVLLGESATLGNDISGGVRTLGAVKAGELDSVSKTVMTPEIGGC